MAPVAQIAELAVMHIILMMTGQTIRIQNDLLINRNHMTQFAFKALVTAFQFISRLRVVIESPKLPTVRVMAHMALSPQSLFVHIIFCVTGVAIHGRIFERLRIVALAAGSDRMQSDQRKFGQVVIEFDIIPPTVLVMTAVARIALLAIVHIIGLMTTPALRIDLHVLCFIPVTVAALKLLVLSRQAELGIPVVIERARLPVMAAMAPVATVTISSFMNIIQQMTVETLHPGLYLEIQQLMTAGTCHLRVPIF